MKNIIFFKGTLLAQSGGSYTNNGDVLAFGENNILYVKGSLSTYSSGTVTSTSAGSTGYRDGAIASAKFNQPEVNGLAYVRWSSDELLYILDGNNKRIRQANLSNSEVTTIAGDGAFVEAIVTQMFCISERVEKGLSTTTIKIDRNHLLRAKYKIRRVTVGGQMTVIAGQSNSQGYSDGTNGQF
eukprot:jgi/Bigna1/133571/aug1.21_g8279